MIGTKVGVEGWTVVHSARQQHYDDRYYGQFLGTRQGSTGIAEWIVARRTRAGAWTTVCATGSGTRPGASTAPGPRTTRTTP
ncbi:hypothetical protein [Streptomyces acidiscabies]|uniref:Uncharacterized protein n=1 Tax=Streptomyces acidiscabies TaxID=42234 RepID=A0ABU4LYL1_9ACTN|nr:hypothetical protein [Streptomyces acidiscabies]MDX3020002.1 hypothetical protein [Streptomyces acidiscabies]